MVDEKTLYMITRTFQHIQKVQNNMIVLVTCFNKELDLDEEDIGELCMDVACHDSSKFSTEQFKPYTDFSWVKKNKEELSEELQKDFDEAWKAHYEYEEHHPEMGGDNFYKFEAIHCACDLQAMSQEFGESSCRQFFEETWKPKSKQYFKEATHFNEICKIMEKCIDCFEEFFVDDV